MTEPLVAVSSTAVSASTYVPSEAIGGAYARVDQTPGVTVMATPSVKISPQAAYAGVLISRNISFVPAPPPVRSATFAHLRRRGVPVETDRLAERFGELRDSWKRKHRFTSSTTAMSMAVEYQEIIGLGPDVIPILLAELRDDPDYWFWALSSLTGEDPVPEDARGNLEVMCASWLEWGRRNNVVAVVRSA